MTCDEFRRFYLSPDQSHADAEPAHEHFARCESCRESVAFPPSWHCGQFRDEARGKWGHRFTTPNGMPALTNQAYRHLHCVNGGVASGCRACREWLDGVWVEYAERRRRREDELDPRRTDRTELDRERAERRAEMLADDTDLWVEEDDFREGGD